PWDERERQIVTGENYHENLRNIAYARVNEGNEPDLVIAYLEKLMERVPESERDERWRQRYDAIADNVEGALIRANEEPDANVDVPTEMIEERSSYDIDFPTGLSGDACQDVMAMSHYPNKKLAVAAFIGATAGIIVRSYNISGTGLNMYIALLMETGSGK